MPGQKRLLSQLEQIAGSQPTSLETPDDRAAKHRKVGTERIPLPALGFSEKNRGGMGISSWHVHEVGHDCVTNGVKKERYEAVKVIEVPEEFLQEVKEANAKKRGKGCANACLFRCLDVRVRI